MSGPVATADRGAPQPSSGATAIGWVNIQQLHPELDKGRVVYRHNPRQDTQITCHLGGDPTIVTAGYGGWDQTSRPRRKPLTQWTGGVLYEMDVPILLSGWWNHSSIEGRIGRIEDMARNGSGNDEPQPVSLSLPGNSPRGAGYVWVIEDISYGDSRRRSSDGHRVYQEATLHVIEYVRPDVVKLTPSKARKAKPKPKPKAKKRSVVKKK